MTTCTGNGTHTIVNNAGALTMRCSTCNTHHPPAPKGVPKKVTPPAPGRPVATIKAGLAKHEIVVQHVESGVEKHFMTPVPPQVPAERPTTPAERMGKTLTEKMNERWALQK